MSTLDELYPLLPPRPLRQRRKNNGRPNYSQIHAHPLPLHVNPLPPLIPHNPLSFLQIACTYIFQLINTPLSHVESRVRGYYSPNTNSVHITEPSSVRFLWEYGFFGKGSLSRSEPTWLDREKKRLGILAADTSEENTAARREERKRFKMERARKEREAIEEKLMEELLVEKIASNHTKVGRAPRLSDMIGDGTTTAGKPTLRSKYEGLAEAALLSPTKGIGFFGGEKMLPTPPTTPLPDPVSKGSPGEGPGTAAVGAAEESLVSGALKPRLPEINKKSVPEEISNQEHLQLDPEEAFFLSYALGILEIYPEPSSPLAALPADSNLDPLTKPHVFTLFTNTTLPVPPNDPFLLLYTAYHHFRSLGWVVRPGLKFGVDYLLYLRGPVFSHAEFAITVLPAYTHPFWHTVEGQRLRTAGRGEMQSDGRRPGDVGQRTWHWLHCVQRVQSQVRKTLVVAWVDVPPPLPLEEGTGGNRNENDNAAAPMEEVNITALLKRYKVREMVVKRWIPNRSRD